MIRLKDITAGLALTGLEPTVIGSVVAVVTISDETAQVISKTPDGVLKDRLLNRADEPNISIATTERPWSFEGDGNAFKLAVEAKRIDLAFAIRTGPLPETTGYVNRSFWRDTSRNMAPAHL